MATKFLHKLTNGIEKSKLIVIEESLSCRGHKLLQCFAKSSDHFLVLKCPNHVQPFNCNLINVLDSTNDRVELELDYLEEIRRRVDGLSGKLTIDSLDPLTMCHEVSDIRKLLSDLENRFDTIVTMANSDVMTEGQKHHLKRESTTWITISGDESQFEAEVTHKKRHRRVDFVLEQFKEHFTIDANSNLTIVTPKQIPKQVQSDGDVPEVTFNLNLRDEERKAKDQLVLPFMAKQNESQVIYYPDENDDVDEDDPDDDLGI